MSTLLMVILSHLDLGPIFDHSRQQDISDVGLFLSGISMILCVSNLGGNIRAHRQHQGHRR